MSFLDLVVGGNGEEEDTVKKKKQSLILYIVKNIVDQPIRDELGLLQQRPKICFGCDVLVFNVVFELSLSLLQTENVHRKWPD